MPKFLTQFPRELTLSNIDVAVEQYLKLMEEMPARFEAAGAIELMKALKRKPLERGPYPGLTLFEAANRIMTDLTILYGVQKLLRDKADDLGFKSYTVELGNEKSNAYDIHAAEAGRTLIGEAFNVSPTFFQGKKAAMLKKLRQHPDENATRLLLYNADAVEKGYKPQPGKGEVFVGVEINF